MHPGDGRFVGAIEGFGFAELEFGGFDGGRRHRGRDRWARIGGWQEGGKKGVRLVDKKLGSVVFKGRGVKSLCEGFSGLLLKYCGKFFILVGREEVRGLVSRGTRQGFGLGGFSPAGGVQGGNGGGTRGYDAEWQARSFVTLGPG